MAPNATHTIETVAEHTPLQPSTTSPKQRRLSWRNPAHSPDDFSAKPSALPHAALMHGHDHEGLSERTRHLHANPEDSEEAQANKSKKIEKMITPYLAQHIPHQYNPLGATGGRQDERPPTANTKFCYRHRPDLLCRRQADEPSMEQLQDVSVLLPLPNRLLTWIGTWQRISGRPAEHRQRMVALFCCPFSTPQPHAPRHPRPVLLPTTLLHLLFSPQPYQD